MEPAETHRSHPLSFGLDKLGLVALRAPVLAALVVVVLTAAAVLGLLRLKVDDSLSELFRTNTPEFRTYEEIDRRFPSSEYDVLVVVEGKSLLSREGLTAFGNATSELQLADGVNGLVSMLSARGKPDATGYSAPVIEPDKLPEGPGFDAAIAALKTNDIIKGKFLSDDGELALIVLALDRAVVAEQSAKTVIGAIRDAAEKDKHLGWVAAFKAVLRSPEVNVLAIHTVNTNWFSGGARIEAPTIVDWKNTHPLLRFVSLDNVQVSESYAVQAPSWAVALVESPQTPLVLAGERGRQRIVWVGFDTLQSTWPLRVSFPIFIANAVEWLNPAAARNSQLTLRAGDPFRFAFPQPVAKAQLIRPDDSTRELRLDGGGRELMVSDTFQQGVYRVKSGTNEIAFAVNLMDAAESDIMPRDELPLGKYARVTATTSYRANVEWWRWFAAVGLGVLMFEWWFYHRRTA